MIFRTRLFHCNELHMNNDALFYLKTNILYDDIYIYIYIYIYNGTLRSEAVLKNQVYLLYGLYQMLQCAMYFIRIDWGM